MAATSTSLHLLSRLTNITTPSQNHNSIHYSRSRIILLPVRCTSTANGAVDPVEPDTNDFPSISSEFETTNPADRFPIEKRRPSDIIRERRRRSDLATKPPPNFEIGWKRTKPTQVEKPKGYVIMDFLEKLEGLMGRNFGSVDLLAKAGEVVAERAREEAEVLRDDGEVEERMVTELFRVLKLMEMDLAMVRASVKDETLAERLEQAKARCRQAILVASSF